VRNLYVRDNVTGSYTLVSPSSNPIAPNDYGYSPWAAATTPDFHHVLFESYLNLTPETDGLDNPFYRPRLYEWDNGVLHLAGVLPDGSVPDSAGAGNTSGASGRNYTPNTLSSDGSRVFFTSPGDSTGAVYMRVNHSSTVMLNANENAGQTIDCSIQGSCPAAFESATADGSRVLFTSSQQLTDDDPNAAGSDLFVYDTSKPDTDPHNLTRLTRDDEPSDGDDPGVLGVLGTSDDQHYVYFAAIGALVSGQPIAPAEAKLYVWHDGVIRYLATLGSSGYNSDGANWAPGLYNQTPKLSRVTPDGKHLLFVTSASQPGGYDNAGFRELYRYDATAEKSVCVSCDPSGKAAGGNAGIARGVLSGLTSYPYLPRALSQDGSRVFFDTPDALVPGDTNGKNDVYEWSDGEAKLISTGKSGTDSYFADAGADGDDVFFTTKEPLVGWDKDQSRDVYVARVNGGLAEPALLAPPCAGDVCQGDPSVPPAPLDAGSLTFLGSGDLPGVMPVAGTSKPKIAKPKTVKGTSALLSVTVSGRGSVAASGSAVKSARRNAAKAGTVRIAVALTKRARATLTAKHVLKVKVRVVYTPKSGKSSSATAALTFKPSSARKKGRS
jgi:hypothetical protein